MLLNRKAGLWTDIGSGLAGSDGVPMLTGTGSLQPGSAGALALTAAAPASPALLFVALTSVPSPFKCGTLVPVPVAFDLPFATGTGAVTLDWTNWPDGLAGLSLYFQFAVADTATMCGVALSNAVKASIP